MYPCAIVTAGRWWFGVVAVAMSRLLEVLLLPANQPTLLLRPGFGWLNDHLQNCGFS